jgi:ribosomal-protein-alanine N-acetyltransferase
MRIRTAELKDLPAIVEMERLCFPEDSAFPPGIFYYLMRHAHFIVASNDEVRGFAVGYVSGRTGAIYTLDVHPEWRRKGIGSMLLEEMEQRLRSAGAIRLRLEASVDNSVARAMYRKAGYREGELIKSYYGRGKDAIRMWKDLA